MSRFDLRWIRRHPLRWLRVVWWHWTVAILLALKATVITDPVFGTTPAARFWPIALGFASAAAAASALAPLERRLQEFTQAVLTGVSMARIATYLSVWLLYDQSHTANVVSQAFALSWAVLAAVALKWPVISTAAGAYMAVAATQDDRGGT